MKFLKPILITFILAMIGFGWANAQQTSTEIYGSRETYLGNANAKVVVIEYGSLTCPHCAHFQTEIFPAIKSRYIDSGKIKYYFRPLPTPPIALSLGLQVIADCAGAQRYHVIDAYFRRHDELMQAAHSANGALNLALQIANQTGGLSDAQARQCIADRGKIDEIARISQEAQTKYHIDSTPSLVIGETKFDPPAQGLTIESISSALDAAILRANTPAKAKSKTKAKKK